MSAPVSAHVPVRRDAPAIRVGFVMHAMQVAGAEVLVARIIRDLRGVIEPTIFCLDRIGELGEELQREGIDVVCLNRRPGRDWGLGRRLADAARARQIEVLHAHQYTPFFYAALARIRGARSAQLIFTEHGRHYPDRVSQLRRWVNRSLLSFSPARINACCRFSAEALRVNDGFGRRLIEVIYNGIDADQFALRQDRAAVSARLQLDPARKYITCIARFHPVKDHSTLLTAFRSVADQRPDVDLLLVGDGPLHRALESQVAELRLSERVRLLGVRRDVAAILRTADVFVLSSVSEAASLTILEAMASECPVVVTAVGGNGELVRDGIDGWLTPRGDPQALSTALLDALNNPIVAKSRARSARERVCAQFQQRQTVERFAQLYAELARPGRNTGPSSR